MLHEIINWIVELVEGIGYAGIVIMMLLESSFFPFPSEVVMIPAGYLASQDKMNIYLVLLSGIAGSIIGAVLNYYIAKHLGRSFLLKYGRFMLIKERTIFKMEEFFTKHGHISTFSGRLIPGVRQYISLPAGIAKMDLKQFVFFTGLGAGLWVLVLTLLGYFIGENEVLVEEYVKEITLITLGALVVLGVLYTILYKRKNAQ
jgi:membrane protein DedA with SNARE-associated domain